MSGLLPIQKSTIAKYLVDNKFRVVEGGRFNLFKDKSLYFYAKNDDYLGEMTIEHKGSCIEIYKLIFKEKIKPIYREYIRIQNKMREFWKKGDPNAAEYKSIGSTTTKVTIDLVNKTQTKKVIRRGLEKEPILINELQEKYGIEVYELENQTFKYKILSKNEEATPYKHSKYNKIDEFI